MKYAVIIFFLFILTSCKSKQKKGNVKVDIIEPLKEFAIINGYPEGFVGCGCAFAVSKEALKQKQFIYLKKNGMPDESKNFEIISINGKEIKWFFGENPADFSIQKEYKTSENVE